MYVTPFILKELSFKMRKCFQDGDILFHCAFMRFFTIARGNRETHNFHHYSAVLENMECLREYGNMGIHYSFHYSAPGEFAGGEFLVFLWDNLRNPGEFQGMPVCFCGFGGNEVK